MSGRLTPTVRRMVLASAAAAAILLFVAASASPVSARDAAPAITIVAQAETKPAADPAPPADTKTGSRADTPGMSSPDAKAKDGADTRRGVVLTVEEDEPVTESGKRRRVVAKLGGHDGEFESFEEMMQQAPWIAGMVVGIVGVVFLVPVVIVALFIWYRLRKNRMLNETMIKLAERGVVPPADALEALASNRQVATMGAATAATTAPLPERAKLLRKGAAWSDLRKGVIMTAVGLGLTLYFLLDEGSPSWLGLVLLFVGIGYCVLWYLEDQQITRTGDSGVPPAGGA